MTGSADARPGLPAGVLMLALSGFYSVLNQVASCLNSYLHLGHDPLRVDLEKIWWPSGSKRQRVPESRRELHPALRRFSSPMISALYRLARSMSIGSGRYADLRILRNSIEHHVVVARDRNSPKSSYYLSASKQDLAQNCMRLGRISKAALMYLGAALWKAEEGKVKRAERKGALIVPARKDALRR